jgi:hypothetical protein
MRKGLPGKKHLKEKPGKMLSRNRIQMNNSRDNNHHLGRFHFLDNLLFHRIITTIRITMRMKDL